MRRESLRHTAVVLGFAACAGCGAFGGAGQAQKAPPPAEVRVQPEPRPIDACLDMMHTLQAADPARQAEVFQAAKEAVTSAPTTSSRLRFGLALATPGHSGSDPVAAQRQLSELLATPDTLLPEERLLAAVELQDVDQRLILMAENKQLRDDASHDSRDKQLALSRRLAAESDENARLRKALDDAQAKLDAITHVERSINDRGASASHTP